MKPRRNLLTGLFLLLPVFAGCAAGGRMTGLRPDPVASRPSTRPSPLVADYASGLNRNARSVRALTASTTVSASGSRFGGGVSGQLALERPRNFKMELERGLAGATVVDVGSNEEEFWFWMKDSEQKAIYVGQYDAQGAATGEFMFHPEWIVEAMGLRGMSAEEISRAKISRGREPNTLVISESRGDGRGGTRLKQTVFDESSKLVKQHIFYAADGKTKVAEVFPSNFRRYQLASETAGSASVVDLPQRVQLRLTPPNREAKDQVLMDIALRDIKLNPQFTAVNREALFTVPTYSGYEVVQISPQEPAASASAADYEEPSRRASHDVILEPPVPLRNEGAWLHKRDPMPLGDDLTANTANDPIPANAGANGLVRPGIPEPPIVR